jgi:hypothetical protein
MNTRDERIRLALEQLDNAKTHEELNVLEALLSNLRGQHSIDWDKYEEEDDD